MTPTWSSANAPFVQGEEVSGPRPTRRRQAHQVLRGEGMVSPVESFEFEGEIYRAGRTRCAPDHRAVERFPHLFRPAWSEDASPEIVRFLDFAIDAIDRGRVCQPRPALFGLDSPVHTEPKGHESWRL
jgi:hypothetical protein